MEITFISNVLSFKSYFLIISIVDVIAIYMNEYILNQTKGMDYILTFSVRMLSMFKLGYLK